MRKISNMDWKPHACSLEFREERSVITVTYRITILTISSIVVQMKKKPQTLNLKWGDIFIRITFLINF